MQPGYDLPIGSAQHHCRQMKQLSLEAKINRFSPSQHKNQSLYQDLQNGVQSGSGDLSRPTGPCSLCPGSRRPLTLQAGPSLRVLVVLAVLSARTASRLPYPRVYSARSFISSSSLLKYHRHEADAAHPFK